MEFQELMTGITRALAEYDVGEKAATRAMEVITALFNRFEESSDALPRPIKQMRQAADAWDQGERTDVDALATISALSRLFR